MPTYEYECADCSNSFEAFQSMSDEPLKTCPECGKEVRRLIFGGAGVIFKGSGFYVTDRKGPGDKGQGGKKDKAACASCPAAAPGSGCPAASADPGGAKGKGADAASA